MTRTQAVQVILQIAVFVITALLLAPRLWELMVLPHEQHPLVLISVTVLVLMLPPSIWWRWLKDSRAARLLEGGLSVAVILSGYVLIAMAFAFISWFTYSELPDELGLVLPLTVGGIFLGFFFVTLPFVLDSGFFSSRMRRWLLVSTGVGAPVLFTFGLVFGPRLGWLFA